MPEEHRKIDEAFDADDPYHSVACIYAGFLCEVCGNYCSGHPEGIDTNTGVEFEVMANTAKHAGWVVIDRQPEKYDWQILCPTCAQQSSTAYT